MRTKIILTIAAAFVLALPLAAAHRHGRDCGHFFDSRRGAWLSVQVNTPFGFGVVNRGYRSDGHRPHYRDSRLSKRELKRLKKLRKQRLRDRRRFESRRHVHGPHRRY